MEHKIVSPILSNLGLVVTGEFGWEQDTMDAMMSTLPELYRYLVSAMKISLKNWHAGLGVSVCISELPLLLKLLVIGNPMSLIVSSSTNCCQTSSGIMPGPRSSLWISVRAEEAGVRSVLDRRIIYPFQINWYN